MMQSNSNSLLVSESIKDIVPDLTDEILSQIKYRYVTAKMEIENKHQDLIVAGSLVGLSIEDAIKIDFKVKLEIGFDIISGLLYGLDYTCKNLTLNFGEEKTVIDSKLKLCSPKIYDLDHENMLCTLALDLVRRSNT